MSDFQGCKKIRRGTLETKIEIVNSLFKNRMMGASADHLGDGAEPVIPVSVRARWNRTEVQLWGVPANNQ